MATKLRPIGHEDRLSVVDHLDELRTRLIVSAIALAIAFGICFWQNQSLLDLLNKPLENSTPTAHKSGNGRLATVSSAQAEVRAAVLLSLRGVRALVLSKDQSAADRAAFAQLARGLERQAAALPKTVPKREPVTLGIGEPFVTTLTIAGYFGLLLALPLLLYQAYAFILPAFTAEERRVALPVMLLAPALFIGGVAFAYFLVLPPAISFLQNFNTGSFDVLVQAKPYYTFEIYVMLALGLVFQLPVGLLALGRLGIVSSRMLIRNWRYAVVIIAVVAALLPGVDPVTTALEMIPLLLLYGLSILLLAATERRARRQAVEEPLAPAEAQELDDTDYDSDPTG